MSDEKHFYSVLVHLRIPATSENKAVQRIFDTFMASDIEPEYIESVERDDRPEDAGSENEADEGE